GGVLVRHPATHILLIRLSKEFNLIIFQACHHCCPPYLFSQRRSVRALIFSSHNSSAVTPSFLTAALVISALAPLYCRSVYWCWIIVHLARLSAWLGCVQLSVSLLPQPRSSAPPQRISVGVL